MKTLKQHLDTLVQIKRKRYHPIIHKIHKKHGISKKTLFYIKEYGPHTHVPKTILKESLKILFFASIISSLGGFALENMKAAFISIIPLVVLLPALNDMIGDFGTIVSSKFSAMLHEGLIKDGWWNEYEIKKIFKQIILVAIITSIFSSTMALAFSTLSGYSVGKAVFLKILSITLIDVLLLVTLLFFTSIFAGLYFYKKQEDPNNLLIPITTSIADFGNMIILACLVFLFF
jgi:mgtE-like transporter